MWNKTAQPMDAALVSRDWKTETLVTLAKLLNCPQLENALDLPVVVNGTTYPSLRETLNTCLNKLSNTQEDTMVLCHGDEHLGNILVAENEYWAIDPGNYTGYNSISSVLNNLVGGLYLFEFEYEGVVAETESNLNISYALKDTFLEAERLIKPLLQETENKARAIFGQTNHAKEFLFVNELRVAVGWTFRNKDLSEILKTGVIFAGLATEHYYAKGIV